MASASFIEKHLTCPICHDEFQDPRRLSCQHVLCLKCLQGHINVNAGDRLIGRRNEWVKGFNCPDCTKVIRIPRPCESCKERWATQITADFKTAGIIEDIKQGNYFVMEAHQKKTADDDINEITPRIDDMATASFIEKHLTCPICHDEFQDPRRLSCQHVFCLKCLQGHIIANAGERFIRRNTQRVKGFNCPECRKMIRIPRPWESSKERWATQITADFKTAGILDDIKQGNYFVMEAHQKKTADDDINEITPRVSRAQVPTNSTEDRFSTQRQQRETVPVISEREGASSEQNQTKPIKTPKTIMRGDLVNVISPPADDKPPELYDLVVLVEDERRIIVTMDFQRNNIITFTLNEEMKVVATNSHNLGCKPWRICKVSKNQVAVTVSEPDGVLLCSFDSGFTFERLFVSKKRYDGIGMLSEGRLVLTTKDNVDIVTKDGSVLQEFTVCAPHVKYSDNSYVACTTNQNIIVTDCGGKTVSCVNQEGKVIWRKKMSPLGVASDADGRIYFVDSKDEVVYMFSNRGQFVCRVVEKSENFSKPSGIAIDSQGFIYVICNFKDITVWKLCSPEEGCG